MDLAELTARESIRDLVARYNANGDTGRFAHVIELFTDDAVMVIEELAFAGHMDIMKIFTGAQDNLDEQSTGPKGYLRHYTATHQIDIVDADLARGRCYFAVLTEVGLDHWGQYIDTYQRVDGRWLFSRREVKTQGRARDSLFAGDLDLT